MIAEIVLKTEEKKKSLRKSGKNHLQMNSRYWVKYQYILQKKFSTGLQPTLCPNKKLN